MMMFLIINMMFTNFLIGSGNNPILEGFNTELTPSYLAHVVVVALSTLVSA